MEMLVPIQPERPEGVNQLTPSAARAKRVIALIVMLIPLLGSLEALRLLLFGKLTLLDLGLFCVFYVIQMFGVSIGFHRYLAHRAFVNGHLN